MKTRLLVKKIFIIGAILIMGLWLFSGCGEKFETDKVSITINAEFREKFLAEEFTVDDFEWDNVEKIEYMIWHDNISTGGMIVYLTKHSKKRVLNAIEHFKTLEFVKDAGVVGRITHN